MIPQSFIADLLSRVDVVDVVGRYVQLKKGGANLMGLCPFHNEKSPSFTVSPSKQFYHCFGCGAHGTAITFMMEYQGMTFPDAVEELARQNGLTVPREQQGNPAEQAARREKQLGLTDVLARAAAFFKLQLKGNERAVRYLKGRGLSGEIAARFGLGYAMEGWQSLQAAFDDYQDAKLVECGLVIERTDEDTGEVRRYDRFRDRIMFPIRNQKGEVIGFGGRVIDQGEPKYLNSPETPVFNKGAELYGLFEARQAIRERGYVLVTEGYMDVVALAQLGFPNAVATLGTATSGIHVQKLLRHTDHIVYSFDGDAAGRKAAWRALESALPFAADDKRISFLFLPSEHDPDSYIREQGTQAFEAEVSRAMPLSAFLLRELQSRHDMGSMEGRSAMIKEAGPMLAQLPAGALRLAIMRGLADASQLNPADIESLTGLNAPVRGGDGPRSGWQPDGEFKAAPFGEGGFKGEWSGGKGKWKGKGRQEGTERERMAWRAMARAPRPQTRTPVDQVIDALLRLPEHYRAARDHLLMWRDDLPDDMQLLDYTSASLADLIQFFENLIEDHERTPTAADFNAFASTDSQMAERWRDAGRPEADAIENESTLTEAVIALRKKQLTEALRAASATQNLQRYREIDARIKALS